ncbi:MAG: hypothetical protein QWI73_01415 [Alphaproteobacteria bacterium]|nr:hypothetical protein [Alphaproteobacteria bacterium]
MLPVLIMRPVLVACAFTTKLPKLEDLKHFLVLKPLQISFIISSVSSVASAPHTPIWLTMALAISLRVKFFFAHVVTLIFTNVII